MNKRKINTYVDISDAARDGWSIKSQIVGAKGTRIYYEYSFNDAEISRHQLKSDKALEYSSYFVIHRDLIFVTDYLEVINKTLEQDPNPAEGGDEILIVHGLFNAALTTYYRAFSQGDGTTVRLNPKSIYKGKYLSYHFRLRALRNEGTAHWGDPSKRHGFEMHHQPVLIIAKDNDQEVGYHIWSEISTPLYGMIDEFRKLVEYLQNHVATKLGELERQLLHCPEVLEIRHSGFVSELCTQASISKENALVLMQALLDNYHDPNMEFQLRGSAYQSVQFTLSSKTAKKSDGLLIDCKYVNKSWDILAYPAVIEVRES